MPQLVSGLRAFEMSSELFPRTVETLDQGVAERVAPGFVAGFWLGSRPNAFYRIARGQRRIVPAPQPMLPETVFDLASVSKVYATATLAAHLVERGWWSWDTPISAIFPGIPHHRGILLSHLLSHTAGFIAWRPFWEELRSRFAPMPVHRIPVGERQRAMRELIFSVEPDAPPGQRALYSDVSFLLLGFAIEEVTGLPLDQAVERLLWRPLGLERSFYRRVDRLPSGAVLENVAATEECYWRGGVLQGQVHDDNTWAMGGYAGHAGAFADLGDLMVYSANLLRGFLSRPVLRAMWTRVPAPAGCERTLGWDTPSGESPCVGRQFSASAVGHLGFTGTSLWFDPEAELAVALLSNRVHPFAPGGAPGHSRENIRIRAFRPRFHDALRTDLRSIGGSL